MEVVHQNERHQKQTICCLYI